MQVTITRGSVCADDDIRAPHTENLEFDEDAVLCDLFKKIVNYLPTVAGSASWEISCPIGTLGYVTTKYDRDCDRKTVHPVFNTQDLLSCIKQLIGIAEGTEPEILNIRCLYNKSVPDDLKGENDNV